MFKEVLEVIKTKCINDISECKECPFNIKDTWHEYCLFMGRVPHEGTTPDEWELNKICDKESEV